VGFFVKVGSRHEDQDQSGLSHFLEHLLFKGTDRFSSSEIDEIFDAMGAEVNAGTSRETTSLYGRFLDQHLDRAFDVMGDMVLRPSYPDVDSERQVVLEEIAMYEDEPSDKVHDVLAGAVFGQHPLGRRFGTPEVVGRSRSTIASPGTRPPTTRCGGGHLDHDRIVSWPAAWAGRSGAGELGRPTRGAAVPLLREGHRAVPHLLRRPGHRA
jgi:hypothetical protein